MKKHTTLMTVLVLFSACVTSSAWAQDASIGGAQFGEVGLKALAAGFAIGIGALGGSIGMGRLVAAALDGMARNPNVQGRLFNVMILGLAFVESLVIYALIIAFMVKP